MSDTLVTPQTQIHTLTSSEKQIIVVDNTTVHTMTIGTQGPAGQGIPLGGTMHQLLRKIDGSDFNTEWYSESEINDGNSGAADTINFSLGSYHKSILTGNVTYTFTAPSVPCIVQLKVVQGAGPYTATWPASVKWAGGIAPLLTPTSGATDIFTFYYDGAYYWQKGAQFGVA